MQNLPANFETIPVTELNVGDVVRFHGARFQVHTAAMYRDGAAGPVMTAHATWLDGDIMTGYFGPGKDWNFQGNAGHRVRRELGSAERTHQDIKDAYSAALVHACRLETPGERRFACDATHAWYELQCAGAGITLNT